MQRRSDRVFKLIDMTVKVLAFGIVKDIFSGAATEVQTEGGITAAGLKALLEERYPRLQQLSSCLMAVNNEYAAADTVIGEKDEIALIPPVSGG